MSRRKIIINGIVSRLTEIDGDVSPWDPSYTFLTRLAKVERQRRFLEEVNDFPAIYLTAETEERNYQTQGLTLGIIPLICQLYVHEENSSVALDNLIQDVEHVIYNFDTSLSKYGLMDVTVNSSITDEGLIQNYGIGQVHLLVQYELAD